MTQSLCKCFRIPHKNALEEHPSCPKASATPASVGSYQNQWRLHRKMLLTVEIWQIILPQGRQASNSPQALVRAAHLAHGGVAHGAGRAESIPSDRK